jgi:hypothetical protein
MGDSKFVDGIIIDQQVDLGSVHMKTKAKILVTRLDLQFWTTKIWGANAKIPNWELKQQLTQNERTKLRELCASIANAGVDVLINQGEIFPIAAEALNEASIMFFSVQDQEKLEMTAKAVHGGIISDLDNVEFVKVLILLFTNHL